MLRIVRLRRLPTSGGIALGVARLLDFGCVFGPRVHRTLHPAKSIDQGFQQDAKALRRDGLRLAEDFRRVIEREQPSRR